jgi:hypothetical protein
VSNPFLSTFSLHPLYSSLLAVPPKSFTPRVTYLQTIQPSEAK